MKWPDAVPFDLSQGPASAAIEALLARSGSAGPVLVLAIGPMARKSGWAARAAIAIADAFATRGERVILADLCLHEPELHAVLGAVNDEGLTDVFLFGASLPHIMQPIAGKQFRLIPASAYTSDTAEVLRHERWGGVFEELVQRGDKLLAYLPVDVYGAASFSDRAGHTVVLAEYSELVEVRARLNDDVDVVAVMAPTVPERPAPPLPQETRVIPPSALAPKVGRRSDAEFEKIRIPKDSARETLIADLRMRQRTALMAPPPEVTPLPHEPSVQAAPREPSAPRAPGVVTRRPPPPVFALDAPETARAKVRGWLTWTLLALLGAGAGAAVWFLWLESRPGPVDPVPATPASVPPAAERAAPPAPAPDVRLPYSVAIASYQVLDLAQEQLEQLSEQQRDLTFYIGPIAVQGTLFFRVMAGPVADSATAVALREALIAARIKTGSSGWDVLTTPYAFLLGEYHDRGDAEIAQRTARGRLVPSYIVPTMSTDGAIRYRLYAGAFTGPGDAEFMRQILTDAGLPDNLVERIGSIRP